VHTEHSGCFPRHCRTPFSKTFHDLLRPNFHNFPRLSNQVDTEQVKFHIKLLSNYLGYVTHSANGNVYKTTDRIKFNNDSL